MGVERLSLGLFQRACGVEGNGALEFFMRHGRSSLFGRSFIVGVYITSSGQNGQKDLRFQFGTGLIQIDVMGLLHGLISGSDSSEQ